MDNNFIELLKNSFENPSEMDLESIQKMVSETNKYLASLQNCLTSNDPQKKEEALASAMEIQKFLEAKASQFAPFMATAPTDEEKAIVAEIEENVSKPGRAKQLINTKIKVS